MYKLIRQPQTIVQRHLKSIAVISVVSITVFAANFSFVSYASTTNTRADAVGTVEVSGANWLGGEGVDIYSNGNSASNSAGNNYMTINNKSVLVGEKWQCVELINRLYLSRGWTGETWWGNGNQMYEKAPSHLTKEANGSIVGLKVGDVISFSHMSDGVGHAAIVNSISGSTVQIANQNTTAVFSSATLSADKKTLVMAGWSGYDIIGVIHKPVGDGSGGGGSGTASPRLSAVQHGAELSTFKRGGDKAIWKNTWQPASNAWSGWSSLQGVLAGDPAAISYGGGLHVFAVSDNGQLVQKYWNGSIWSGWTSLGGSNLTGRPAVAQFGDELVIFVRNSSNNELYKKSYFPTSGWGPLSSLSPGVNVASNPSAVQYYGELTVVARGGSNDVLKWTWNGSGWGSGSMGGITGGDPVAMKYNNELQIWATDYLGQPAKRVWNGATWSGWNNLGGTMGGSLAVMQYGNELNVFARNKNNSYIYKNTWQPSLNSWSGWISMGGNIASDPTSMQYNSEMVIWGTNYASMTDKNTWNGTNWSGFVALP